MPLLRDRLLTVLDILNSSSDRIKELALISDIDPFYFFRAANLSGLDLTDQDLTGLNFDDADFRNSTLNGIKYDPGAFNNSKPSKELEKYFDPFDGYLEDLISERLKNVYLFVRFRENAIDDMLLSQLMYNTDLSDHSGVSVGTIRKARRSQVVSIETGRLLASVLLSPRTVDSPTGEHHELETYPRQPMVELLVLRQGGGFNRVARRDLFGLIDRFSASHPGLKEKDALGNWSPDTMNWYTEIWSSGQMNLDITD